jgi:hypothetical protein
MSVQRGGKAGTAAPFLPWAHKEKERVFQNNFARGAILLHRITDGEVIVE